MDRNLIDYLPPVLKEVRELKAIAEAEQPEVESLWNAIQDVRNDQYIQDATEYGVKRREGILGIISKATDSMDIRKFRITTRENAKLPYTYRTLEQQLKSICGESGYTLERNSSEHKLIIRVRLDVQSKLAEVDNLLKRIVPANMIIDLDLLYNTHSKLSGFTHQELSTYKHIELREVL